MNSSTSPVSHTNLPFFSSPRSEALCLIPHLLSVLFTYVRKRLRGDTEYEALPGAEEQTPEETQPEAPLPLKRQLLRLGVFSVPARSPRSFPTRPFRGTGRFRSPLSRLITLDPSRRPLSRLSFRATGRV